jgi:hypothetical protein
MPSSSTHESEGGEKSEREKLNGSDDVMGG